MIDKEQLKEAYKSASEKVQDIFTSDYFTNSLSQISQKNHLHVDQSGILSNLVSAVILGLISRDNFNLELRHSLGLSEDTINLIIYDLNQQIFAKIRDSLAKITAPDGSSRAPQNTINDQSEEKTSTAEQTFDQKMGGITNVPKQTVEVKEETVDNKVVTPTATPRDPYREPI